MAEKREATKKRILLAIKGSAGLISVIAKKAGVTRQTVYTIMEKYQDVREAFDDEREALVDIAESQLIKKIKEGDNTAITFFLKSVGRDRGYGDKTQVELSGGVVTKVIKGIDPDEV